jgi:hypothetical protein
MPTDTSLPRPQYRITAILVGICLLPTPPALAQGFAAYVSPPRVVAQAEAGQTLRQVIEIQHVSRQPGSYRFYTNDWALQADQSVVFSDALAPDSCRPWVAIERRELNLDAGARYRYRLEVTPPAGTPARECRFALMVEGLDSARVQGAFSFPVGGRIGVIVYVAVGDATPLLSLAGTRVASINGKPTPVLDVRNSGTAHGRLEGYVNAVDAEGQRLELAPADGPILPGETRQVALVPVVDNGKPAPTIRYPLAVKGNLEWGKSLLALDVSFAP